MMVALYRVFCCAIQYCLIHLALCVIFFPARVTCDDEEERASHEVRVLRLRDLPLQGLRLPDLR
jgi:hypothetical protein